MFHVQVAIIQLAWLYEIDIRVFFLLLHNWLVKMGVQKSAILYVYLYKK